MASSIIIRIPQGNTSDRVFQAFDGSDSFDLTGFTIRATVKTSETANDDDEATVVIAGSVADGPNGVCSVQFAPPVTDTPGTTWYRIDALSGDAEITIACGPFVIDAV
jgi:hypothetical protein